jgi:hypothetical protein
MNYSYQAETGRAEAAAFQLVGSASQLATDDIPVIALRPEPGADPKSPALATFWKVVNGQRETLGHLNAIVLICLDDAHTSAAYHHARDLISWCAPKFEFDALTPTGGDGLATSSDRKQQPAPPAPAGALFGTACIPSGGRHWPQANRSPPTSPPASSLPSAAGCGGQWDGL